MCKLCTILATILATIDKILSAIIEFQCDKINNTPWPCSVLIKQFLSRTYKTECFEKLKN